MTAADDLQFVRALPYFHGLSAAELADVGARCATCAVEVGEIIALEGQPATALYIVRSGRVRVFSASAGGKREQVLAMLGRGGTFNDAPVFDDGPAPASAQATAPGTSIYVVPRALVTHLLASNPQFARNVARVLAAHLRQMTGLVRDLSFRHSSHRLATLLLEESVATGGAVRLTQYEMAARVGAVREVVSRALRDLEAQGVIARQRDHSIQVDSAALRALLERDTDGSL